MRFAILIKRQKARPDPDVWGAIEKLHVATVDNPIRLQGQYEDIETCFYYNRHRYFESKTGSFITSDPLGLEGGNNPYIYLSNAYGWIDPTGLTCERTVNGTKIFGKGQRDKTPGHDQFSELIANKLAMSGKFREIHLNRQYNSAIKNTSLRRPDVIAVDMHGRVHAIELASKTDMGKKLPSLTSRNRVAQSKLPPAQQGDILVFEYKYNAADIKSGLDTLIGSI